MTPADVPVRASVHRSTFIVHRWAAGVAVLLFFAFRIAILIARDPFFDELFSVWMARQPAGNIVPLLTNDSGPPLYYFLARFDSVDLLRCLSLLFATVQFTIVIRRSVIAALLLAVYPPAALFAVDARAYALCAMFVTAGVVAWAGGRRYLAAVLFVAGAYSHYYGVLFFPILAFSGAPRPSAAPFWRRKIAAEGGGAPLLAVLLFIPGFYLAFRQPSAAFGWVKESVWPVFINLSTAGRYPEALFTPASFGFVAIAAILLLSVIRTPVPAVLIPLALLVGFHLAGRPVYFPMRFESVIAGPLLLWIAGTKFRWQHAALAAIGAIVLTIGIRDHLRRPLDPYREAALLLLRNASPTETIVATGYPYLETVVSLNRPVVAFPADQATHPGWRSTSVADPGQLPRGPFLWIGEAAAPELATIRGVRKVEPLFTNGRAIVARVSP